MLLTDRWTKQHYQKHNLAGIIININELYDASIFILFFTFLSFFDGYSNSYSTEAENTSTKCYPHTTPPDDQIQNIIP